MVGRDALTGRELLLEAEMFGPYRLDELIGRGGMGEVYRAFDTKRKRAVALKRLPAAEGADAEFVARFRREAAIAARLRAPHVVPIYDYGDIDGRLFIDMRLVRGTDLARLLADGGPLEPARAVGIIAQVASALDDAHAEGLVHRDVKPSNVLLTNNDFAYLADFGIVRELSGGPSITVTGATVGTVGYMAPERFLGRPVDHLADVYALGCVLYEALTGRPPFDGESQLSLMYAHVHQAPPRASTRRQGVPPALDEVIARGMAKDPQQRFATAGQLASAASAALRGPVSAAPRNDGPAGATTIVRLPGIPDTAPGPASGDRTQQQPKPPPTPPTKPPPTAPPTASLKPRFTPLFKPQPTPLKSPVGHRHGDDHHDRGGQHHGGAAGVKKVEQSPQGTLRRRLEKIKEYVFELVVPKEFRAVIAASDEALMQAAIERLECELDRVYTEVGPPPGYVYTELDPPPGYVGERDGGE